jgi:hypothetical protein
MGIPSKTIKLVVIQQGNISFMPSLFQLNTNVGGQQKAECLSLNMFCPNSRFAKSGFLHSICKMDFGANEFKKCEENCIDNEIWIVRMVGYTIWLQKCH